MAEDWLRWLRTGLEISRTGFGGRGLASKFRGLASVGVDWPRWARTGLGGRGLETETTTGHQRDQMEAKGGTHGAGKLQLSWPCDFHSMAFCQCAAAAPSARALVRTCHQSTETPQTKESLAQGKQGEATVRKCKRDADQHRRILGACPLPQPCRRSRAFDLPERVSCVHSRSSADTLRAR